MRTLCSRCSLEDERRSKLYLVTNACNLRVWRDDDATGRTNLLAASCRADCNDLCGAAASHGAKLHPMFCPEVVIGNDGQRAIITALHHLLAQLDRWGELIQEAICLVIQQLSHEMILVAHLTLSRLDFTAQGGCLALCGVRQRRRTRNADITLHPSPTDELQLDFCCESFRLLAPHPTPATECTYMCTYVDELMTKLKL